MDLPWRIRKVVPLTSMAWSATSRLLGSPRRRYRWTRELCTPGNIWKLPGWKLGSGDAGNRHDRHGSSSYLITYDGISWYIMGKRNPTSATTKTTIYFRLSNPRIPICLSDRHWCPPVFCLHLQWEPCWLTGHNGYGYGKSYNFHELHTQAVVLFELEFQNPVTCSLLCLWIDVCQLVFFLNKLFHNLESTGINSASVNGCCEVCWSKLQRLVWQISTPNSSGHGLDGPVGVYESMGGSKLPAHNPTYVRQNMVYDGIWFVVIPPLFLTLAILTPHQRIDDHWVYDADFDGSMETQTIKIVRKTFSSQCGNPTAAQYTGQSADTESILA